jgi:glycerophosphoryl diester phosphodiesterase
MPYAKPLLPLILPLKARGIQASLWTLNKREPLARAFNLGVLNVTTQDTRLAVELRGTGKPGGNLTTPGV